jgi:hypothetical protein
MTIDQKEDPWLATFREISPLYLHLHQCIKQDSEMLALRSLIDARHPVPIVFMSTVNALILRERPQPLVEFYANLHTPARAASEVWPYFRSFVLTHQEELRRRLPTARMQTNEVTRCANLLLAFELVHRRSGKPLALIELGASAGLNLGWDGYTYLYDTDQGVIVCGDASSPVKIHCQVRGQKPPFPIEALPPVSRRSGLDLFPLDILNEHDALSLVSYIWPEEVERYQLLTQAIELARMNPPVLHAGDALILLPELLESHEDNMNETLCVYHSYAISRSQAISGHIKDILKRASTKREIYEVALETDPETRLHPSLELFCYRAGKMVSSELLATCVLHGETMEWL